MSKHFIVILFSISFLSCNAQTDKQASATERHPIEIVQEREQQSLNKDYSQLGELIGTFDLKVKTYDTANYKGGFVPWADLENPETDLPNLDERDNIIVSEKQVKIIIDYPLMNPYEFTLKSDKGFSRGRLLTEISARYYALYAEEERTATIKTVPIEQRTMMYNRNETNGKYGIWGHDIADMDLSRIFVYRNKSGDIVLTLFIES